MGPGGRMVGRARCEYFQRRVAGASGTLWPGNTEEALRQDCEGGLQSRRTRAPGETGACGHPGSLPQILKLEGMEDYVFMRPGVNEKTLPGNLFWWKGIDGSRVLTYRIPISYNDGNISIEPQMRRTVEEL